MHSKRRKFRYTTPAKPPATKKKRNAQPISYRLTNMGKEFPGTRPYRPIWAEVQNIPTRCICIWVGHAIGYWRDQIRFELKYLHRACEVNHEM